MIIQILGQNFSHISELCQVGGLIAMLVALFFLSQGWATSSLSPFYILSPKFLLFCLHIVFSLSLYLVTFLTMDSLRVGLFNLTTNYHQKIVLTPKRKYKQNKH